VTAGVRRSGADWTDELLRRLSSEDFVLRLLVDILRILKKEVED
jgi:hypothetical protein